MISPETLRRFPYFAKVEEQSLKQVAKIAQERVEPAEKRLFSEDEVADTLYIIQEGEVDIQYELGDGQMKTVDTLVQGDLLVWSALVDPYRTTTSGLARSGLKLIAIDAPKLRQLMEQDPVLGFQLMSQVTKLLAHRLERSRIQLATHG